MTRTIKVLLGAGAMTLALTAQSAAQEQIRWKLPNAFPSNLPSLGENVTIFADIVNRVSGGDIQVKVFEAGALVPPLEMSLAVENGSLDAGWGWLGYDAGRIPASPLFSSRPFAMDPVEYNAWWYDGGGEDLARDIYAEHNIVPIYCGSQAAESAGWYRGPIEGLEVFDGMKIRIAGLGGEVLKEIGAAPTVLGGGEIFPALEKGALDAAEYSMPIVDQTTGFYKVANYNYFPGWHQVSTSYHLLVNKGVWEGLDQLRRDQIEIACESAVTRSLAYAEALQGDALAKMAELGVEQRQLPDQVLKELKAVTDTVLQRQADADADFARVYESQTAFSESYSRWKRLGYLSRDFGSVAVTD